jgi:hypothetical protein
MKAGLYKIGFFVYLPPKICQLTFNIHISKIIFA